MTNSTINWDRSLLNYGRSRPMYSPEIHKLLSKVLGKQNVKENDIYSHFTDAFSKWINSSKLNSLKDLSSFKNRNIIRGVTHSLDDLHAVHGEKIVVLPNEYKYHERIVGDQRVLPFEQWKTGDIAVISFPFSHTGNRPEKWEEILNHCEKENIELHIDAAWYGICRDLELDLSSSAIKSISFSLSKPLGLGNYPIGIRFQKSEMRGPVETVNEFKMISPLMIHIGLSFIEEFPIDFFQYKYYEAYKLVVKEFGLIESNSIHVALEDKGAEIVPVGIRGFLRQIVEGEFR